MTIEGNEDHMVFKGFGKFLIASFIKAFLTVFMIQSAFLLMNLSSTVSFVVGLFIIVLVIGYWAERGYKLIKK